MIVSDDEVIAGLTYDGSPLSEFFLIGGQVCHINARGDLMGVVIENAALAAATVAYLRRFGAREYPSFRAYFESGRA